LAANAQQISQAIRQHWSIENQLHWVLDVTFDDDQMRTRRGDSSQNLVVLRQIALNVLKQDASKGSLKQKRYRATLDDTFLEQLLSQI
jgi:predicted transposase YbfD/YdcC